MHGCPSFVSQISMGEIDSIHEAAMAHFKHGSWDWSSWGFGWVVMVISGLGRASSEFDSWFGLLEY